MARKYEITIPEGFWVNQLTLQQQKCYYSFQNLFFIEMTHGHKKRAVNWNCRKDCKSPVILIILFAEECDCAVMEDFNNNDVNASNYS